MTTKVYIAGASTEAAQCKAFGDWVRSFGGEITVPWWDDVLAAKVHDRELGEDKRVDYASKDLQGVADADIFWLVIPSSPHGRGAWVELGYAIAWRPIRIVSGDCLSSIFTSLAFRQFTTHEDALAWVQERIREAA